MTLLLIALNALVFVLEARGPASVIATTGGRVQAAPRHLNSCATQHRIHHNGAS